MRKLIALAAVVMIAAAGTVGCGSNTAAEPSTQGPAEVVVVETPSETTVKAEGGMAAMEKAAEAKKYLFALFRKEEDGQTAAMRSVLQEAMKEVADRADSVEVSVSAASERAIVDKFDLDRAPMPLILAIAPNGAVTGGFPTKVEKQELLKAFASPCTEKCMKQLQENRLVFLCVQNGTTESKDAAMEGVRQFKADARFAQATEIVMLDPTDAAEADFLKDLQIDPKTEVAVTVFLAPPGMPVARYEGATSKDEIVATLQKASSACGPGGCGPGGCPPQQ
ncbi:MAG TPA: hypothetical protein VMY37_34360 [Thermoguttaceae bacterium]|nr:hypothetical protein [Thermoguttaceae bacterium]